MTTFDSAANFVLANEGGLFENKDGSDPGGITNFGISLRFLREVSSENLKKYSIFEPVNEQTIRDLTMAQAKFIYRGEFWDAAPFEKIMNQNLANYIFDMCVNHGIAQGVKLAQRAVWACQKQRDFIKDDGVLGSKTIYAVNMCSFMLLVAMQAQRDGFYRRLVALDPTRKGNLDGWLNRCYRT
jgi:lysozyme family protein